MCDGQDASVPISLQPSRQGGWVLPWVLECTWKLTVLVEVHDLNMRSEQDVVAGVLQQHVSEPLCVCWCWCYACPCSQFGSTTSSRVAPVVSPPLCLLCRPCPLLRRVGDVILSYEVD